MSMIVEDGTGLANANSYGTTADYKQYWKDRGTTLTQAGGVLETQLVRATDYIELVFAHRLKGEKEFPETQALSFPRTGIKDRDGVEFSGVPEAIKRATFEYAKRIYDSSTLLPDPSVDSSGVKILSKKEKVGPISEETTFSETSPILTRKPYPSADRYMIPFVTSTRGTIRA